MATADRARRFWDERAEEDAFYFVDNRLTYGAPNLERFWAGGEADMEKLLGQAEKAIDPSDDIVEIGCGVGRLTRVLAREGASVRALDVSPRMIELAQEHNPALTNVEWIVGDGTTLAGIDSGSADVCVSHVVFQHISDPEVTLAYVREIGRVLRPGGWAVFQVSNDPTVHNPPRGLRNARNRIRAAVRLAPRGQAHPDWCGSYVAVEGLRAAADDGGMHVERLAGEGTQYCVALTRKRPA